MFLEERYRSTKNVFKRKFLYCVKYNRKQIFPEAINKLIQLIYIYISKTISKIEGIG